MWDKIWNTLSNLFEPKFLSEVTKSNKQTANFIRILILLILVVDWYFSISYPDNSEINLTNEDLKFKLHVFNNLFTLVWFVISTLLVVVGIRYVFKYFKD